MFANKEDYSSVKIVDFGLSKELEYKENQYGGTVLYMAPEIILNQSYDFTFLNTKNKIENKK